LLYAGTPLELYGTRNSVKPIYIVIIDKTSENPKDWAISSAGNQITPPV
jgi:hypothetical protein